jgi:hypothetical protein
MPKLTLETWQSTEGKTEQHYFVRGIGGIETYVVGFNPEIISETGRAAIIALVEAELLIGHRKPVNAARN